MYPAPNSVVGLFRFDWNSGFAKIWWPGEFLGATNQNESSQGKATSELQTHEYLRIARVVETNQTGIVPGPGSGKKQ